MSGKFILLMALLVVASLAAISIGARAIPISEVWAALVAYAPENSAHVVIWDLRVPRLLAGLLIGSALGIAGVIMQSVSRNPLADPGLLGINSGASFAIVLGAALGLIGGIDRIWFALIGAASVAIFVYALAGFGSRSASPIRLVLAGAAVTALFSALTTTLILLNQEALDLYRFWVAGSISGLRPEASLALLPFYLAGLVAAGFALRGLGIVQLGEDHARALGIKINRLRLWCLISVSCLAGFCVALAGPIGFVGLVVPHISRIFAGLILWRILVAAALIGPVLLLSADVIGRIVLANGEVPVGICIALIGGPCFVGLVAMTQANHHRGWT